MLVSILAIATDTRPSRVRRELVSEKAFAWMQLLISQGEDPETARRRAVTRGVANLGYGA